MLYRDLQFAGRVLIHEYNDTGFHRLYVRGTEPGGFVGYRTHAICEVPRPSVPGLPEAGQSIYWAFTDYTGERCVSLRDLGPGVAELAALVST